MLHEGTQCVYGGGGLAAILGLTHNAFHWIEDTQHALEDIDYSSVPEDGLL